MATDSDMLTAALTAAARGWHVFPLRPGSKVPALHRKDRCPRTDACRDGHQGWAQRATTDPGRIRSAWSTGRFNVGIATGPSGHVVLDLDTPKPDDDPCPADWDMPGVQDGQDVLAVLADRAGEPVPVDTFTVATPSGGLHLHYRAPDGVELRNTAGTLGWKVDTRAHGGYVVAPGSAVDGRPYRVLLDLPVAPLPPWLATLLRPAPRPAVPERPVQVATGRRSRYVEAAVSLECAQVQQARKGQRNARLFVAAKSLGQLVAGGALREDQAVNELFAAAWAHISVGAYSQSQAMATIRSGLDAGAHQPRQVA